MLKYPRNETVWVTYLDRKSDIAYIITTKAGSRDAYHLYQRTGETFKKLGRARTPTELEETFKVKQRL